MRWRPKPACSAAKPRRSGGSGRIAIEAGRADSQVFGIRRFHDQQAARAQCTQRLGDQVLHQLERQVLDQVECRHQRQAVVGLCAQRGQRVAVARGQAPLVASGQHAIVEVHAPGIKAVFAEQLEPLATSAPEVERGSGAVLQQRRGERRIRAQPVLDDLARAAVTVFEGAVERRLTHRWISSCGSSQLLPTNSRRFMFMTSNIAARSRHS
jgi:hypothetical protein